MRDISVSGMYFETGVSDAAFAPGSMVNPMIKLNGPWGKLMFKCDGEIVRIETRDGEIGVAVKIIKSVMVPGCASEVAGVRYPSAPRH